jgi:hypothetical protein
MKLRRLSPAIGAATLSVALLAGCDAATAEHSSMPGGETALAGAVAAQGLPVIKMYKNPSCACCGEWVEHMRENGFRVDVEEARFNLMQIKAEQGVSPNLASCHTAVIGDYVLEGHVPADVVKQLVAESPDIRGLAVPGMPTGVPGMPDPGANRDPYEIVAIQHDGGTELYATR